MTAKTNAKKNVTPQPVKAYINIEDFLETASFLYPQLDAISKGGFIASLEGKRYFNDEVALKNKLETYLGISNKEDK